MGGVTQFRKKGYYREPVIRSRLGAHSLLRGPRAEQTSCKDLTQGGPRPVHRQLAVACGDLVEFSSRPPCRSSEGGSRVQNVEKAPDRVVGGEIEVPDQVPSPGTLSSKYDIGDDS